MLDEKRVRECRNRVEKMLQYGQIVKEKKGRFVEFFISNSINSFSSANLLYDVSTKEDLKKQVGRPDFNGFLWVVNSSYYSMFYMARALLESIGVKLKSDQSIHSAAFDSLIYYFYSSGKIEKSIIEEFQEAGSDALEVLGRQKAKELMEDYSYEKDKRSRFTYEMGETALRNKAQTSIQRARRFNETIRKMID